MCVKPPLLVWAMFPQNLKERVSGICPITGGLVIILDGSRRVTMQGDSSEFFPLADHVHDSLVTIGLEIADLETPYLGLPQSGGE